MLLRIRLLEEMKTAMKSGDKPRLGVIRLMRAAVKQREIDERIELDDEQVLLTLDKMVKQRRDSILQFEKADRQELADQEKFEIGIIQEFLPAQLGEDEITAMIAEAISATGAQSMKDMGKVMGMLRPKLQGRADMGAVSGLIKQKLSG